MPLSHAHTRNQASAQSHLNALQTRHAGLSEQIDGELSRPSTNDILIKALKREKLRLKDEIELIRHDLYSQAAE